MMWSHIIEKGLSLPSPRAGYGKEVVRNLVDGTKAYLDRFGTDQITCVSTNVLSTYYDFNLRNGIDDGQLKDEIEGLRSKMSDSGLETNRGGAIPFSRERVARVSRLPFSEFVRERYSIRNFTDEPVSLELIKEAVQISLKTPSVCNRQSWRVHCYQGREKCKPLLELQNGNRGFEHTINTILIVTSDLNYFGGIKERNEPFIDGGMFGMSLVYALHHLGLGSCCLNLCLSSGVDKKLRMRAEIPDAESFIFMLAVGHIPDKVMVAESCRRPLSDILSIH